ncbi:hypothetical protein ID866_9904 [Astraeus odoratus]|nr:hypothetical protein ID866_9904 [Astraeus odoratus]
MALTESTVAISPVAGLPIPFLPLGPSFDYREREHWNALSLDVEHWLVSVVFGRHPDLWKWGTNLFRMAFVATYPSFREGDWRKWNPKISLEGSFIAEWMSYLAVQHKEPGTALPAIWLRFGRSIQTLPAKTLD